MRRSLQGLQQCDAIASNCSFLRFVSCRLNVLRCVGPPESEVRPKGETGGEGGGVVPVVFQPGRLLCWCFSVGLVRRARIKHAARQVASGSTRAPPISARFQVPGTGIYWRDGVGGYVFRVVMTWW